MFINNKVYYAPFLISVWPDSYVSLSAHCLVKSGKLISLQDSYITSCVGNPAARKPPTAVKAATASRSNYHCRHVRLRLCRSHPLPNSTGPYGGPSTSAILFCQSSRRQPTSAPSYFPTMSRLSQALIQFTYVYCRHLTCSVGGVEVPRLHLSFLKHSHFWSSRTSCTTHIHNFSTVHLRVLPPPHLQCMGAWRSPV